MLVAAFAYAATRPRPATCSRVVDPRRVSAGTPAPVELTIHSEAARPSDVLSVVDSVDGGRRAARFALTGVTADAPVRASYPLTTARRGRYLIGPATVTTYDPFGVSAKTWTAAAETELVVLPRVHPIAAPHGLGAGLMGSESATVAHAIAPDAHGEFHALREYELGDDLRRVHWRSTARLDQLMIRQDEALAHARVTVVLDVRAEQYDHDTFETAVEAAASVIARVARSRRPVELVTNDGTPARAAEHGAPLELLLDALATVEARNGIRADVALLPMRRSRADGLLVAITGAPDAGVRTALAARARIGTVILVTTAAPSVAGRAVLVDASQRPFRDAWNLAMARWPHVAVS